MARNASLSRLVSNIAFNRSGRLTAWSAVLIIVALAGLRYASRAASGSASTKGATLPYGEPPVGQGAVRIGIDCYDAKAFGRQAARQDHGHKGLAHAVLA